MTTITSTFTENEKTSISKLKDCLPDIIKDSGVPENYALWGVLLDKNSTDERLDIILVKFLRAKNCDVSQAKEMLTKSLKWRLEFRADTILTESFPSDVFCKVGFIHKHDKKNRPVTYNLYGGLNNEEVFGNLDRFLRWRIQLMEKGIQLLDFKTIDQMIQVHDYNLITFASYDTTAKTASKTVTQIMQDNYPEFLAVKFFVNVPWWGDWVFKFISIFLSEQTKAKFVVTSANGVKDSMLEVIDEDNLPVTYGGKSIVPELENKGSADQPPSE
ncbi:23678_t:CDS:2 [Dentiscutata erythropus]|uniref:23678_t:CDS:1 n=1 Tax=Dentiscutata erythropus TaxID=1348616 RepID=A0A9N8VA12_9GLOM|nr:23678_t:CDS:2 [Dentiscutata erythropus]